MQLQQEQERPEDMRRRKKATVFKAPSRRRKGNKRAARIAKKIQRKATQNNYIPDMSPGPDIVEDYWKKG